MRSEEYRKPGKLYRSSINVFVAEDSILSNSSQSFLKLMNCLYSIYFVVNSNSSQ